MWNRHARAGQLQDDVHVTSESSHLRKRSSGGVTDILARHLWRRKDGLATLLVFTI